MVGISRGATENARPENAYGQKFGAESHDLEMLHQAAAAARVENAGLENAAPI